MKILAVDTTTEACSAALLLGDSMLTRYSEPGRGHAELILPMVDELLKEAGFTLNALDCIAVGRGPGAFTGIRIGISVVQGLAFGAQKPVVPVSDLAALAQRAADKHKVDQVLPCIDARMNEVYWGAFVRGSDGLMLPYKEERVSPPDEVRVDWSGAWAGAGTGWGTYPAMAAPGIVDATLFPRAEEIARFAAREFRAGRAVPAEQAQPVYLRDKVAWTSAAAKSRA
jgi:tRNA threonylcarbamoyladenosine biosynthesis protein TsaB